MRKISLIAMVAALILIGVGMEAGAWTAADNLVLTANPVIDSSGPISAKGPPTSHSEDYSLVFPAIIGQ
jgi:hypothetical protein